MNDMSTRRATFTEMRNGTAQDWQIIAEQGAGFRSGLADRVLEHLRLLDGDYGGFPVDRLTHSLQSATRAHRDGLDEEYVVCALLHDIGDVLAAYNHPELAAAILRPFVSEKNCWMIAKHGHFQTHYYYRHVGMDHDMREDYRSHEWFDHTAEFCEKYDQNAFDPAYDSMTLADFEPMVRRVLAKPRNSDGSP